MKWRGGDDESKTRHERPGRKKGEIMREYSRNPTYPDGDAYDPTYIPVTETKDKEEEVSMKEPELKLRCPKCRSAEVRTNRNGTTWCRHCGYEAPRSEFEEKEER